MLSLLQEIYFKPDVTVELWKSNVQDNKFAFQLNLLTFYNTTTNAKAFWSSTLDFKVGGHMTSLADPGFPRRGRWRQPHRWGTNLLFWP